MLQEKCRSSCHGDGSPKRQLEQQSLQQRGHRTSSSNRHQSFDLLHADSQSIDKLMASELNALSFDDREALCEEVHGVRSLAPSETPGMIENALLELKREIHKRLRMILLSPSRVTRRECIQHQYLEALLLASEFNPHGICPAPIHTPSSPCSSWQPQWHSNLIPEAMTTLPNGTVSSAGGCDPCIGINGSDGNSDSNFVSHKLKHHKYAYAVSDRFRIKFLRADLFDVKKAAARYLKCIDFLVNYFGLVALERPLYLKDLDKNEQKLLKEGGFQLMPSRDRFGRRIIVFLGVPGVGYSHVNRFKVVMYLVFQVASDDDTTQRNGIVALYSCYSSSSLRDYLELAVHQNESIKFFEAVPLRYSAFHYFSDIGSNGLRGMVLNSIGKRTRLITRVHSVSSVTETCYKLRSFGIPPEDFPVTSSGSVKTKMLMKWIKLRLAVEEAREKEEVKYYRPHRTSQPQNLPTPLFFVIECPDQNSVIFRNGGVAWDHPGNVRFRATMTQREQERELQKTKVQKSAFLDRIIEEAWSNGLNFLSYDENNKWYEEIRDYGLLRKKVFQALRDQSARRKRLEASSDRKKKIAACQVRNSSTTAFLDLDNNYRSRNPCSTISSLERLKEARFSAV